MGRGGPVGGMNLEIGVDVCALPCVKQIDSGNLLYSAESSLALCGDLDGWDGGVLGVPERGIYVYI